jgi:hypothetical protein
MEFESFGLERTNTGMLIQRHEVRALSGLLGDIRHSRVPEDVAEASLLAFFSENPHLLMLDSFDEHRQHEPTVSELEGLETFGGGSSGHRKFHKLPLLEYRTRSGRWATILRAPQIGWGYPELEAFLLSTSFRSGVRGLDRLVWSAPKRQGHDTEEDDEEADEEYQAQKQEIIDSVSEGRIELSLEEVLADIERRVAIPRTQTSVLWSPKIWVPREIERQRQLLDVTLRPHLERWTQIGFSLDDLNASEFEDLVGELLRRAGLEIYKVRQSPQGGRDLIARGVLIPGEEPIQMAVEVKHRRIVDRPELQLALYQNRCYPALIFAASGRFTAGVFEEKAIRENHFRLFLKDGVAIGEMVRVHFGLRNRPFSPSS